MAKIALRAYNQEIDSLIEARQIDEAIAHCRHILKTFPKHIQTYRLLGKAFLESQRYGDAADILQRVLSSIPDDFIAHVGMSVIREDEGNLAESIYHMERAFEVQPANRAIQEELRRLYGKRDGFEPPKVRLSRGALARMYAKGELYAQAISELRAALAENPDRLDLRLQLARNYMRMGQRVEAVDACNLLLRKLPYCLEANQIMAEVLQNSERAADAVAYRRRVAAMDPYESHVSALMPDAGRVPDGSVTVERLSWQPGMPIGAGDYQPEWAASLGVHVPEEYPGLDEFPDWLGGTKPAVDEEAAAPGPALVEEDGVTPVQAEAAEIPDWMERAGWKPGSGAEQSADEAYDDETEDLLAGMDELSGLPEAELPDWVKEMAPQTGVAETQASEWVNESDLAGEATDAELGELLEGAPAAGEPPEWLSELADTEDQAPQLDESLAGLAMDETKALHPQDAETEMPDWLKDLASEAAQAAETPQSTEGAESAAAEEPEAIPDWLSEAEPVAEEPADEVVDWLAEAAPLAELETRRAEEPLAEEPLAEAPQGEDLDAALAWLEGLAAKQGADEALFSAPEDRPEAPPDWVTEEVSQAADERTPAEIGAAAPAEELLDWLGEAQGELEEVVEAEVTPAEELPDWLQEAKAEAEETIEAAAAPAEEIPDWLQEAKAEAEETLEAAAEPAEEIPDWLGEAQSELEEVVEAEVTPAEELPDWLQEAKAEAEETIEAAAAPAEVIPDWLQEAKAEAEETVEAAAEPVEELPDWLQEAKAEAEETIEAAAEPAEELPDWLQEAKAEAEETIEAAAEPAEEIPDWLKGAAAAGAAGAAAAGAAGTAAGVAGIAASAAQGLGEDDESEAAAEPVEEIPDWLQEAKAQAEETIEAAAEPAEELPDWLQEARAAEAEVEESTEAAAEALPNLMEEAQAAAEETLEADLEAAGLEDWGLETESIETPAGELGEAEILPDWMKDIKAEAGEAAPKAQPAAEPAAADDWLAALETPVEEGDTKPGRTMQATQLDYAELGITPSEPAAEEAELAPAESEAVLAEELPDWLQEIAPAPAVESPASDEKAEYAEEDIDQLFAKPEEESARTPAWEVADSTLPETTQPEVEALEPLDIEQIEAEEIEAALLAEEIAPQVSLDEEEDAFLSLFGEAEETAAEVEEAGLLVEMEAEAAALDEAELEPAESIPDWLQESAAGEAEAEAPALEGVEGMTGAETDEAAPESAAPPPAIDISQDVAEMPDFGDDMDAAFAWLEGLAAKQGAQEALLTAPEDRPEAPPEWVASAVEEIPPAEAEAETLAGLPEDLEAALAEDLEAELPAMIEDEATQASLEAADELETALEVEAAPEVEAPFEAEETAEIEATREPEELDVKAAWQDVEDFIPVDEAAELEAEAKPELPDWLEEIEPAAAELETPLEIEAVEPEALDVKAAWQDVEDFIPMDEAAELEAEAKPELPDWLEEIEPAAAELETPLEIEAVEPEALDVKAAWQDVEDFIPMDEAAELEAEAKPELPAWLQEVEQVETQAAPEMEAWTPPATPEVEAAKLEPLDLNKAGLVDLERLPGIGFTLAQKILDQRDQTGPFNSVMDLGQIAGITPEMLAELEGWVTVETPRPGITAPHVRVEGPDDLLAARQSLLNGDLDGSLEQYSKLIRARRFLPDILRDLQQAVEANPRQPEFWQALGDAYLRDDQVQPALDAYTKVEELLR